MANDVNEVQPKRLQVNFKTPSGTLINVYATSEADLAFLLQSLNKAAPEIAETEALLSGTQVVAQQLGGTPVSQEQFAPPSQGPAPSFAQPAPQQAAPAATPGGGPVCQHGPMQFKSGTSQKGRAWSAYMCPLPKNSPGACEPQWQ